MYLDITSIYMCSKLNVSKKIKTSTFRKRGSSTQHMQWRRALSQDVVRASRGLDLVNSIVASLARLVHNKS